MGLLSWLRGTPPPEAETRDYVGGSFLPYDYIARPGLEVAGANEALRISAVWACVNLIANHVATMPFEALRRDTGGVPQLVSPRPSILDKPHPDLNRVDWLTMVMSSLLLRGNAYLLIVGRNMASYPTALLPLDPSQVDVDDNNGVSPSYRVGGKPVAREDIVHIRGLTMPGKFTGLSIIDHARTTMGASIATDRFASQWFAEGLAPSGVLQTADDLDPADADELARAFEARHGRSRRPVVLTNGLEWKPLSITPEESQFLATREFQVHDIARLFGVPSHMIAATDKTTSYGAGIQAMNTGFHVVTVQPWLVRIEIALTDQLPRGQYVKANAAGGLRGTVTERYAAYEVALRTSIMCADEIRALEDLPPLPDGKGQVFYVPAQVVPAGERLDAAADADDEDEVLADEANAHGEPTATGPNSVSPGPGQGAQSQDPQTLDPVVGVGNPAASD